MIRHQQFKGEAPRVTAHLLGVGWAQRALNCRLDEGDLDSLRAPLKKLTLAKAGRVNTVSMMARTFPLHFVDSELAAGVVSVDVASIPSNDAEYLTILTGLNGGPCYTDLDLATNELYRGVKPVGAYPYLTRKLGVPAPDVAPEVEVVTVDPEDGEIPLVNPGAEDGDTTGWLTGTGTLEAIQSVGFLTPQEGAWFFYGGTAANTRRTQRLELEDAGLAPGQDLTFTYYTARGPNASKAVAFLQFFDEDDVNLSGSDPLPTASGSNYTWAKTTGFLTIPEDAAYFDIVMLFERVGAGDCDAFIDDIKIKVAAEGIVLDGTDFGDFEQISNDDDAEITIVADQGNPAPGYQIDADDASIALYRNVALKNSPKATFSIDIPESPFYRHTLRVIIGADSDGAGEGFTFDKNGIFSNFFASWKDGPVTSTRIGDGNYNDGGIIGTNTAYHVDFEVTSTGTGTAKVAITTKLIDGTQIATAEQTIGIADSYFGLQFTQSPFPSYFDNLTASISPPVQSEDGIDVLSAYVYTNVNSRKQESGPSPASATVARGSNSTTRVTLPYYEDDGYDIAYRRIYRAAAGATGVSFLFVAEVPVYQLVYVDGIPDNQLGEPLATTNFELPPEDLLGITMLPNNVLAGITKFGLRLSAAGYHYAFPLANEYGTDKPPVGLGAIDSTVVILTEGHPYTAFGSDPSAYQMSKDTFGLACTSKLGIVSVDKLGVVYPSPVGYIGYAGQGGSRRITEAVLTPRQFKSLNPETMVAAIHGGDLYFWFEDEAGKRGYIYDLNETSTGLVRTDVHPTAVYTESTDDQLLMVLDEGSIDNGATYAPAAANDLVEWDASEDHLMNRDWISGVKKLSMPAAFERGLIWSTDYSDIGLEQLREDGTVVVTRAILNDKPRGLVSKQVSTVAIRITGSSRVQMVAIAESIQELQQLQNA
jgi:hypothetical protein